MLSLSSARERSLPVLIFWFPVHHNFRFIVFFNNRFSEHLGAVRYPVKNKAKHLNLPDLSKRSKAHFQLNGIIPQQ